MPIKKFLLAILLFGFAQAFCQELESEASTAIIEQKDGNLLEIKYLTIYFSNRTIEYILKDQTKTRKLKFRDVSEINAGMSLFKVFDDGNGYYIKVESDSKFLAIEPDIRGRNTASLKAFVLDKTGNVLEKFEIDGSDNKKMIEKRAALKESLKRNFADCPKFLAYFANFDYEQDTSHIQLWNYMAMRKLQDCN